MEYRPLGRTGLSVSVLGFGCGNVGGLFVRGSSEEQRTAVQRALDAGVNYFDTANGYGNGLSEKNLGRTLKDLGASPHIGTKVFIGPEDIGDVDQIASRKLDEGLDRLGIDRVDVCTLHTQVGSGPKMLPASDIVGPVHVAIRGLVASGRAGALGFTGLGDTSELRAVVASEQFDVVQCYYNVLNPSAGTAGSQDGVAQDFEGLIDQSIAHGMGAIAIRVLAGGVLAESETRHQIAGEIGRPLFEGGGYAEDRQRAERYLQHLSEFGVSNLTELAVRFALSKQELSTVLVGLSDDAQLEQILRFVSLGPLSPPKIDRLLSFRRLDNDV